MVAPAPGQHADEEALHRLPADHRRDGARLLTA
jgi:hypothetical protein